MSLSRRDGLATGFALAAGLFYLLWRTDSAFTSLSVRGAAAIVLALGVASCTAERGRMARIYGGPKQERPPLAYVVTATVAGAVALVSGVLAVVTGNAALLAVLVATIALLWVLATTQHRTSWLERWHHNGVPHGAG